MSQASVTAGLSHHDPDFSLVLGGPLYQLYLRTKLVGPALELLVRRILAVSLFCWLPLLLLAGIDRHLIGGVAIPFLLDPEVHIRFLASIPLLIASEVLVHLRMQRIVGQFLDRGIIADQDRERFHKIIAAANSMRNSITLEIVMLVLALTVGYWMWRQNNHPTVSTWYLIGLGTDAHLTAAGQWYAFVSLGIFRFILFRWYVRLFIWYRFLWQVRKLPLHLNLYHPDQAGGLGFLSGSVLAFTPVLVAQTMAISGAIFSRILYTEQRLPAFKMEIAGAIIFLMLLVLIPLGFFTIQLHGAALIAKREFGALASHYVDDFRRKWVQGENRTGEPLLGTSDIQSLADLANSFNVVSEIRLFPISKQVLVRLAITVTLPLLPLVLTMVPLGEIIGKLFKLAF